MFNVVIQRIICEDGNNANFVHGDRSETSTRDAGEISEFATDLNVFATRLSVSVMSAFHLCCVDVCLRNKIF